MACHRWLCISLLLLLLLSLASQSCHALHSFGFDIHHRFSDPVKEILGVHDLPDKGTRQYYVAMAHRDRIFRGRRLAAGYHLPLTFIPSNETYQIEAFGFLHFANVSVGTPPLSFLVALDTGSDLFWLPCNCTKCVHGIGLSNGEDHPQANPFCAIAAYVSYRDNALHLIPSVHMNCGQVQTGAFLDGAAPNGLFGLGMSNESVPSILAKEGLTSNSFSMCFGSDGLGRITFGDNSSLVQGKTPFNLRALQLMTCLDLNSTLLSPKLLCPTYNITVTQIIVGEKVDDLEFHAIFDSGTSFTYLNDPAYKQITNSFNSEIKLQRHSTSSSNELPFEYCYELSPNQTVELSINLTMKGGDNYLVTDPIVTVSGEGINLLCLGVLKSNNVNIIGQNFMTGYRIVFDRENMILGWRESNCYDDELSTLPINRSNTPAISPAIAVNPEARSSQSNNPVLSPNLSFKIKPTSAFMMALFVLLAIF
ncbi:Aspartic proteinase-like protein 1 [Glycine soja]|nr:Aspartic proteinase-like protein 1 [Glycine soja]